MTIQDHVSKKDLRQLIINEVLCGAALHDLPWGKTGSGAHILGELIDNGEFDDNTDDWAPVGAGLSIVADGKIDNCVLITNTAWGGGPYQTIDVEEEKEYVIEGYVKEGTSTAARITAADPDQGDLVQFTEDVTADHTWQRFKFYVTTDIGQTRLTIYFYNIGGIGTTLYYDRVSLQENRRVPFIESEVVNVNIDEVDGYEVFSLAEINIPPSSTDAFRWYCEDAGDRVRLYVRTFDGDSPGAELSGDVKKYCVSMDFWLGFCNRADSKTPNKPVTYERAECIITNPTLDRWDTSAGDALVDWDQSANVSRDADEVATDLSAYAADLTIAGGVIQSIYRLDLRFKPRRKYRVRCWYYFETGGVPEIHVQDSGSNVYLQADGTWTAIAGNIVLGGVVDQWNYFELEFIAHADYEDYWTIVYNTSVTNGHVVKVDCYFIERIRQPLQYHPFLGPNSIPNINQGVGDYYQGDIKLDFGAVKYINAGYFYERKPLYLWHNRKAYIKFGAFGADYEDLERIFSARTKRPKFGDGYCVIDHTDARAADLKKIPNSRFTSDDIDASGDQAYLGKAIPILFGQKVNITPIELSHDDRAFKFSETIFGGVAFPVNAISAITQDGVTIAAGGVDYTEDLAGGGFTVISEYEDAEFRVTAQGVVIDFESGAYSTNVADIVYFLLVHLNGIDPDDINYKYLLALKAARTQQLGDYIGADEESLSFIKRLMQTATFHLFPLTSGPYAARHFDPTVPDDTPRFKNEDIKTLEVFEETDQCFREVLIQYDKDPTTGDWEEVLSISATTEPLYKKKQRLIIQTDLVNEAEAETLAAFFLDLIEAPPDKIKSRVDTRALLISPASMGIFSYQITEDDGIDYDVLDNHVYRILELSKNIHTGETQVIGTKSMQVSGVIRHTDVAHSDHTDAVHGDDAHDDGVHSDVHTDRAYTDSVYVDSYSDHTDESHSDNPHGDTPHEDFHGDGHNDTPYIDEHTDHTDEPEPHADDHNDTPYDDFHADLHDDVAYDDHADSHTDNQPHSDSHSDTPHVDSGHLDSYSDAAHADEAHVDTHSDLHDDSPHSDSYF